MNQELKPWRLDDRQAFADLCNATNHAYLTMDFPVPMRQADARWWLEYAVGNDGITGVFRAVYVDGEIVGQVYLRKMEQAKGQISFFIKRAYEGQGIMTQAVSDLLEEIKEGNWDPVVYAEVYAKNHRSIRVLEKNGFIRTAIKKHVLLCKDGSLSDQYMFEKKI